MLAADLTVEVRDKLLVRHGVIRPEDLNLTLGIQSNNVGTWKLQLAADHPLASEIRAPGSGLIVSAFNDVLASGPMTRVTFAVSKDNPGGTLTVEGVTDDIALADRLCYPQPSNANPTTQTLAHDIRTGPVETVMHGFVNANAGPGAPATRQVYGLTMGTNGARGATITSQARFQVLGKWLSDLAPLATLNFRVVQRGAGIVFETTPQIDRTGTIRLDVWNNTLSSEEVAITAPKLTQTLVGGQGEMLDRVFYAATNATATDAQTAWNRRIEFFISQTQTDDTNQYVNASNKALADGGFTGVTAKTIPMDDATMQFGIDWNVGDLVTVVIDNAECIAPVTGMALAVSKDGCKLGAILGDPTELDPNLELLQRVNKLAVRTDLLETST